MSALTAKLNQVNTLRKKLYNHCLMIHKTYMYWTFIWLA